MADGALLWSLWFFEHPVLTALTHASTTTCCPPDCVAALAHGQAHSRCSANGCWLEAGEAAQMGGLYSADPAGPVYAKDFLSCGGLGAAFSGLLVETWISLLQRARLLVMFKGPGF